jgi:DeoR family transcriptional regulator of aga operon
LIGGEFRSLNRSFSGPAAIEMVSKFSIDKAFLCVAAIDVERGMISTVNPNFATFQREVIAISNRVTVIADTSKFRRSALAIISPLSDIDVVITSEGLQPEWRNGLVAHNVEVIEV